MVTLPKTNMDSASSKVRLLAYSPYAMAIHHTYFERFVTKKFAEEGAQTLILSCDGFLDWCEWGKHCNFCRFCKVKLNQDTQTQTVPIISFLKKEKQAEYPFQNMNSVNYKGFDLVKHVTSSYLTCFRLEQMKIEGPEQEKVFKNLITSAVNFIDAMENAIDEFKPTHIFTFNGRFFSHQILCEMAQRKNITFILSEMGSRSETYSFKVNHSLHEYQDVLEDWKSFFNGPISEEDLVESVKGINGWRVAKNRGSMITANLIDPKKFKDSIDDIRIKSKKYHRTMLVLTSCGDEFGAIKGFEEIFKSQSAWLDQVISFLKANPNILGMIRFHPNTMNNWGQIQTMVDYAKSLMDADLPPNIVVIPPWSRINTYELFEIADCGLTYGSTTSLELQLVGKPVLICSRGPYYYLPFFEKVSDPLSFFDDIQRVLSKKMIKQDILNCIKFYRQYFISTSHPFRPIKYVLPLKFVQRVQPDFPWQNYSSLQEVMQNGDLHKVYEKMFNINQPTSLSGEDQISILDEYQFKNISTTKHILMVSNLNEKDFYHSDQYKVYRKSILYYGHYTDVIFPLDQEFQKNWYQNAGGFAGIFSKPYRLLYWTIFQVPYLTLINRMIKLIAHRYFKTTYKSSKTVELQIKKIKPDYILSFVDQNIFSHSNKIRTFRLKTRVSAQNSILLESSQ